MRKIFSTLIGITALLLVVSPAFAKTSHTVIGQQVNASACDTTNSPVINVTFNVINDQDSGTAGNPWAYDNYNKLLQVWQQNDGSYCAVVRYAGQFTTIAGASPQNTGTVANGIQGTFAGGYVGTFNGVLDTNQQLQGNLDTKDYACTGNFNCTVFDWLGTYFPGYSNFNYTYWGWNYQAGNNGSWVNAMSGNSGDITGYP